MNNFLIGFLTVVVIVIAAWLGGWLPSWLASRLPESPMREGFRVLPPPVKDWRQPTEEENLAYLKYGVELAVAPIDTQEMDTIMDKAAVATGWMKQSDASYTNYRLRSNFKDAWFAKLVSSNLAQHPFYKVVMSAQSAKDLAERIYAACGVKDYNEFANMKKNILTDFMELAVKINMTDKDRSKFNVNSTDRIRFFDDLYNYFGSTLAYKICTDPGLNSEDIIGTDASALCAEARKNIRYMDGAYGLIMYQNGCVAGISSMLYTLLRYAAADPNSDRSGFLRLIAPWHRS